MHEIMTHIENLCRPKLLLDAARFGASKYRRKIHLSRLLGYGNLPSPTEALARLLEMEADAEYTRKEHQSCYDACHHIDVVTALMAEFKLLRTAYASQ